MGNKAKASVAYMIFFRSPHHQRRLTLSIKLGPAVFEVSRLDPIWTLHQLDFLRRPTATRSQPKLGCAVFDHLVITINSDIAIKLLPLAVRHMVHMTSVMKPVIGPYRARM